MKPTKPYKMAGTLIGMALWGFAAYLVYPHWSAWLFGALLLVNTIVLVGQEVKSP